MPSSANEPTAFRPPGYPIVLAGVHVVGDRLLGSRWTKARVANALLGTLAVALIGLVAAQLWSRRTALAAMAVLAVDLPLVLVGGSLMSDTLFVTLVLATVLAGLRGSGAPPRTDAPRPDLRCGSPRLCRAGPRPQHDATVDSRGFRLVEIPRLDDELARWSPDAAGNGFYVLALLALAGAFTRAARAAPAWL